MPPPPVILFFFFFLCCSSLSVGAVAIHVGAIVNTNSRIGREQKVAIDIAAQHFNFSTSALFLNVRDSDSFNPLQSILNAETLIKWGAQAIIGTGTWPEVTMLADITSAAKIPLLSLATTSPSTLAPRPFLVRMSYSDSAEVHSIADIMKSYNWRRVIVIYEDDGYGSISGTATLLADALRHVGAEIVYKAAFPPLDNLFNPKATMQRELRAIRQQLSQVYIIFRSSPSLALHLFKEAKELGMMAEGHVWIANDDITSLLDSAFSSSFISSYMQGIVGIKTYFNETTNLYNSFCKEFRRRYELEYSKKGEQYFEPGFTALRAYDTVRLIACAAAKTKKQETTLLEGIFMCRFLGLSGVITFRRDGTLTARKDSPAFRVINIEGRRCRELGFWLEGFGFYKEEDKMGHPGQEVEVLGPVFFPGGPKRVPGGWGTLRIGVPARTIFDQFVKVEYYQDGKVKAVTGFCIDVFRETLKRLKYDLQYHEFIPFNGTYDELISQVALNAFDGAVGDITILGNRLVNVTFTEPFLNSGLSMLMRAKPNHRAWMLTKPFTRTVWVLIVVILVYTGIILWCLEKGRNPEFSGPWWVQLGATLWFLFSSIFYAHGRVYSYYTKTIIIVWLFVVLILTSIYTATLSSILTTQKLEPLVHDIRVGCDGDSFIVKYLQDVLGYKEQSIERIGTADNYTKAFESGKINAAYLETPYLRLFLSQHDGYTVYGETHRLGGFGFVFQKGSPIAADISEAILELVEDGTLKQLEKKWFSFSLSNCPSRENNRNRDSLSLDSLWELFLFTGGTTTIVFLLFIAHLLRQNCPPHNIVGVPLSNRFKQIWQSTKVWNRQRIGVSSIPSTSSQAGYATNVQVEITDSITQESLDNSLEQHEDDITQ